MKLANWVRGSTLNPLVLIQFIACSVKVGISLSVGRYVLLEPHSNCLRSEFYLKETLNVLDRYKLKLDSNCLKSIIKLNSGCFKLYGNSTRPRVLK